MELTRWQPGGITSFRRQLDRPFDSYFGGESSLFGNREWSPAMDEIETAEEIVVKAELPGVDEKDISITVSGNTLRIKGQREAEKEEKEKEFHRLERSFGSFERVIPLPSSVDSEKISADYAKGVLEVHIPKKPGTKPKAIEVKAKKG